MASRRLTAFVEHEAMGFLSRCPDFDVSTQGDWIELASANMQAALGLSYETASDAELPHRPA